MAGARRLYRARVATSGADSVSGNVAFTLTVSDLHGVPVVTTQIVHPTKGRVESRPFTIEALDTDAGLLANLTSSERWYAIGRILDVQFSDNGGSSWTTYGTGRISGLSESDGPGKFNIEVSDEGWKARNSRIFTVADTTQMWPHGIKARWGEFQAAVPADGTLATSTSNLHRIRMEANGGPRFSRDVLPVLIDFADTDKKSVETLRYGTDATEGNFEHLRLNYAGTDYEVVSFGPIGVRNNLLGTLEDPAVSQPESEFRTVTIHAWVHSASAPPASGDAFLHAPTAEPSEENPLHVGLADGTHTWGAADTGSLLPQEIHPATLTRIYWDETGQVYDSASVTALENDSSFRTIAPRITEMPSDPDKWFQEHVWGPSLIAVLVDSQGRRKLVDMRQPQDVDPNTLPVIDASNARQNTWRLISREAVNQITWRLLQLNQHGRIHFHGDAVQPVDFQLSNQSSRGADGVATKEIERGPFQGDTISTMGVRDLTIEATALHWPVGSVFFDARAGRDRWLAIASRELFDIYQDGAWKGSVEVGRTLAETLDEGGLVILDQDELKGPNPQTETRTGQRLVRILTMERHPTHAVCGYLDLGKKAQPLAAPTVVVAQDATDEELVNVTISNVPAGATAIVEFGYSSSSTPPEEWAFRRVEVGNETITFGDAPGTGWAHARVKSVAPNRIRSIWATGSDQLAARPKITAARVELDGSEPVVFGTPDANTAGVRITYEVHDPETDPTPANASDFDATNLSGGIALDGVEVPRDQRITVELEPWTGFSGGAVSGAAGPKVSVVATRFDPSFRVIFDHWEYHEDDTQGGRISRFKAHVQIDKTSRWKSMHVVAFGQEYDFNIPTSEAFEHVLRNSVTGGTLDPSLELSEPTPSDSESHPDGLIKITPYTAADGAQGSGQAGTTVIVPFPRATTEWDDTAASTGHVLTLQSSGKPLFQQAPEGGIAPSGTDDQALFTRSGATTWDDIAAPDVSPGTFPSGEFTFRDSAPGALARALKVQNTAAEAVGTKVGIPFYNKVTTTGLVEAGRIEVGMTDVGQSTFSSDMIFYVSENGTLAEAGRFKPDKRFALGDGITKAGAANTGYVLDAAGIHDPNRPTIHAYSEIQAAATETVQALEGHAVASHSTGTVTQAIGTLGFGELTAGGTLTRIAGVRGGALISGNGTVTEAIGVEARAAEILGGATPTITEAISLMVRKGTAGSTNWSIVSEGDAQFQEDVHVSGVMTLNVALSLVSGGTGADLSADTDLPTAPEQAVAVVNDGGFDVLANPSLGAGAVQFLQVNEDGDVSWASVSGTVPDSDAGGRLLIGATSPAGDWVNSAWGVTSAEPVTAEFLRHPGGVNQTATWEPISSGDLPSHSHDAENIKSGTFGGVTPGGGYTFPTAVTMESTLGVQNTAPEVALHVGDEVHPFSTFPVATILEAASSSASGTVYGHTAWLKSTAATTGTHIALGLRMNTENGSGTFASARALDAIVKHAGAGTVTKLAGMSAVAWVSAGTVTDAISIEGRGPFETSTGAITNAYTAFLKAPSSVGGTRNITLWLDDPSGTGANTIEAASGAKLTTGGVWTDAPSFSWLKEAVEPINPGTARDVLLAMQPILYDRTSNGEPGMGFALDHLPDWLRTLNGRRLDGPAGVAPMEFATLAIAGWQDHESRISRLEAIHDGGE